MTPFKDLIQERDELWESATVEVIESIPNTINGIIGYLSLNDELSECHIAWRSVTLIDGAVELMGSLVYPVGSTFTPEGQDPIVVKEDMAEYFKRTLCLYLPLPLVLSENSTDVFNFLNDMDEDRKNVPEMKVKKAEPPFPGLTEKERISLLMQAKNPTGKFH